MAAASSTAASTSTATCGVFQIQDIDASVRFGFVSDHSDHAYTHVKGQLSTQAQKRIMLEWKLLMEDLPESITVRAYEKRIELLRAVIVGAKGTPYHDGLYFFDFAFPTDYPWRPPLVHYRSYGYRINPNLYADGKVCLSLLNTWFGGSSEAWNPKDSTVLQVLLSIQALVLNERPFYNEPTFGGLLRRFLSEGLSSSYNEETFLLSCKTMTCVMIKPPKGFEGFVASHFRGRARTILSACEAYVKGQARVGHFKYGSDGEAESCSSPELAVAGSRKFRESLRAIYPNLSTLFRREGAWLHGIKEDLGIQGNPSELRQALTMERKFGLVDKIVLAVNLTFVFLLSCFYILIFRRNFF